MNLSLRLLFSVLLVSGIRAYDTGHHNDLTRNAMQLLGYNQNAQIIAGIANFFIDYFSYSPIPTETIPELNSMHFDNIFTMKNASYPLNYWTQLTLNTKKAIQTAATNGDALEFIMTIGGTLHSVQDFYTHSDWVDSHYRTECDCYRSETWIQTLHEINGDYNELLHEQAALHTYSWGNCNENERNCYGGQLDHGDACGGINKDSYLEYVRPYWEPSYGFAFSGTVEWITNIHQWASEVNADIINFSLSYYQSGKELRSSYPGRHRRYEQTQWLCLHSEDGHWKGPGSGSLSRFLPAQVEFTTSQSIFKSKYLDTKIWQRWTSPNVYDAPDVDQNQVIDVSTITQVTTPYTGIEEFTPVVVRTVAVQGQNQANKPSYFATVSIDGMEFVETVYINHYDYEPHWTSIKFVNTTASPQVDIQYTLKDNKFPLGDNTISITPAGTASLSLTFDIASHNLSGDVTGVYDSISNTFTTKNDNANVGIQLFITATKYANCSQGLPQQYCPNEAYVFAGAFQECSGETIAAAGKTYVFGFLVLMLSFVVLF